MEYSDETFTVILVAVAMPKYSIQSITSIPIKRNVLLSSVNVLYVNTMFKC